MRGWKEGNKVQEEERAYSVKSEGGRKGGRTMEDIRKDETVRGGEEEEEEEEERQIK